MTPVEVMIGTMAFGACVFAVGLLAYYRLGKLQSSGAAAGHGTARHISAEGEVTGVSRQRVVLEKFLRPSGEVREKK
jgi:hypothetical protein